MQYDYDVIVIGGGAAGLTSAGIAATSGAKTLLISDAPLGGDCTWHGCVPSKTLLHQALRHDRPSLTDALSVVHRIREDIYEDADSPARLARFNIETWHGRAHFLDPHTLAVVNSPSEPRVVTSRKFILATGSRPLVPNIEGLSTGSYLTTDSFFDAVDPTLTSMAIIGAGAVGIELSHALARFGVTVDLFDTQQRILPSFSGEAAALVCSDLEQAGVRLHLGQPVVRVQGDAGHWSICTETATIASDQLLIATGRTPNLGSLALEAAGVTTRGGVLPVSTRGRTNVRHIAAAGDLIPGFHHTHAAEMSAKSAASNLLFGVGPRNQPSMIPSVLYCPRPLARIGVSVDKGQADAKLRVYKFPYRKIDRAITDDDALGHVALVVTRQLGRIVGAEIIGSRADDLIGLVTVAMANRMTLTGFSGLTFAYPTLALGVRRAADQWFIDIQRTYRPWIQRLARLFRYRGTVPIIDDNELV
ncbi:MAG: NAD(P)/FAD-dependent oxidoreductase [Bacteroidetes bacterium]|nr:NAD(P)/FAD-dependent oxidoreductase [Bacteroidota bacterium]